MYFIDGEDFIACSIEGSAIVEAATGGACASENFPQDGVGFGVLLGGPILSLREQLDDVPARIFRATRERRIAGIQTTCYEFDETAENPFGDDSVLPSTTCLTQDGTILAVSTTDEAGSYGWEATDVGGVTEADFEPPYPVRD
jgi:hypothetical protein